MHRPLGGRNSHLDMTYINIPKDPSFKRVKRVKCKRCELTTNSRVPGVELVQRDVVRRGNAVTGISALGDVPLLAVGDDAGLGGGRCSSCSGGDGWYGPCRRRGGCHVVRDVLPAESSHTVLKEESGISNA